MFYSESLLTREGPLAQVWLAANLERKLSKTQFLQSNISQSTQAIVRATISSNESEALALRLSGQLLYGVVRIYSRKAKYLLDDVSDALLKIKSAFKSSANTITLPVNATIVQSMNQLILQDTVTQGDLLYQEPLVFDDEPQKSQGGFFATQSVSQDADESIEMPRNRFDDDLDDLPQDDGLEIELNFDLDQEEPEQDLPMDDYDNFDMGGDDFAFADESIEQGRAVDDGNLSEMMNESAPGIDLGFDNFDQPLETIDDIEEPELQLIEPVTQKQQKKKRTVNKPLGKKIVNDRNIELEVAVFSDTSNIISTPSTTSTTLENKRAYLDHLLSDSYINPRFTEKFSTIKPNKRAKITEPEIIDPEPAFPDLQSDREEHEQSHNFDDGMDFAFDNGEDLHKVYENEEHPADQSLGIIEERESDSEDAQDFPQTQGVSESTGVVEAHITSLLENEEQTTFTDVIQKDVQEEQPLAQKPKSEATRVFFELLVLATGDKVALKQNELFGEISISAISV